MQYDLVTVGGGMAASALGRAMAAAGAKVLILEQEKQFRDRVRGEYLSPWGVVEAKNLGVFDALRGSGAHEVPLVELGFGPRDLVATTPQGLASLTFPHPQMQETLLWEAQRAGAEVRRGVSVQFVQPGEAPIVQIKSEAGSEQIAARMVVGADGRGSNVRKWTGFTSEKNVQPFLFAGVYLENVAAPTDMASLVFNFETGFAIAAIPQSGGRFRSYLSYPVSAGYRLQGEQSFDLFRRESGKAFPPCETFYANAKPIGPLASFDGGDTWVKHPYREGVALIGDAAATSDPSFGQGMSLTLRDARVLRDHLLKTPDWDEAGNAYAAEHDSYFRNCHNATVWLRQVFQEQTPEAKLRRQNALPLIIEDATRVPDHMFGGPDLPTGDTVRARFFGEI
jgi:2-polyprenyl-6-methoxyphenol hydroxylase-like FAD-dependent oxidoreductase